MKNEEETTAAAAAAAEPDPSSYGIQRIDIALDNADGVFLAGKTITGKVILDLAAPLEVLGIRVRCKGEARVHFTDRSVGIRRKFSAEESYVHLEPYIYGDGESRSRVPGGVYPFSIRCPEKIPCSFEGLYGRIRYSLRACLVLTEELVFYTNVLPFTLALLADLNRDSLAPLPISERQSKTFIGQKEPLNMELSLPVRGFVPGQTVPLDITVRNDSNVRVSKIRIVLKKVVTYHTREKSRRHKEIVVEIELPVSAKEETHHERFDIPSIPPTGMHYCTVIDVQYALKVEACVDLGEWYYRMLQKNLKIRTNIIVGTVPLNNYENEEGHQKSNGLPLHSVPSNEEHYEKSHICRSSKPDKDDPNGDEGDSDGEIVPYSPKYRVYKFENHSSN